MGVAGIGISGASGRGVGAYSSNSTAMEGVPSPEIVTRIKLALQHTEQSSVYV